MNVVITGGLGVLGLSCAKAYLETGANVVISDIKETSDHLSLAMPGVEQRLKYLQCDVQLPENCQRLVNLSESFFQDAIDVFIANAGVPFAGDFLSANQEQIEHIFNVNVLGSIYSAQAAIPSLLKHNQSNLIFTCSLQSTSARAKRSLYTSSKHAIAGLVKSLSLEYARNGLRVNGIAPAAIDTPFLLKAFEGANIEKEAGLLSAAESLPMGRIPTANEFAQTALFLTSPAAASITGQLIALDGGASAGVFSRQVVNNI
jgi:3-oxoacyl-[acyl-carrier protein] reductase